MEMANQDYYNTDIRFSSVEDAVNQINEARENIETELSNFEAAVKKLIEDKDFVGTAADPFDASFAQLKKDKFDSYISLVKDFATVIRTGKDATQETAEAAEADATNNLYLG